MLFFQFHVYDIRFIDRYGRFQKIWVPQNGWVIIENPIKMDDLGENPLFSETCNMSLRFKDVQKMSHTIHICIDLIFVFLRLQIIRSPKKHVKIFLNLPRKWYCRVENCRVDRPTLCFFEPWFSVQDFLKFGEFFLGGWQLSNIFYFHPYLGKIPILTNMFQMGWFNHQPVLHVWTISTCSINDKRWLKLPNCFHDYNYNTHRIHGTGIFTYIYI